MNVDAIVKEKICSYAPQGHLDHTSLFFLNLASLRHLSTRDHSERVSLLMEELAIMSKNDPKAAFFTGVLHDTGKIVLPDNLFDGHNISPEEYALIKEHARMVFELFKDMHLFIALSAGCHHNIYKAGYGISLEDFPKHLSLPTVKKILVNSAMNSICDNIDAFSTRKTEILDGGKKSDGLEALLMNKFTDDHLLVEMALEASDKLKLY